MSIKVFWIQFAPTDFLPGWSEPRVKSFESTELTAALQFCNDKRKEPGVTHVTISSEMPDSVGKPGVDSIVDGKTPDGHDYTWMKRRNQ